MPRTPEAKQRQAEYLRQYKKEHPPVGKRVNITLSESEYARLVEVASESGERPTTFLRNVALAALEGRRVLAKEEEAKVDEFVRVVRGIANNLNQMARYSNTMRGMLDEREVGYQLLHMEEVFRRFLASGGDEKP
jgi:hypothetical protein